MRSSRHRRPLWKDTVVQRLALILIVGAIGSAAVEQNVPTHLILASGVGALLLLAAVSVLTSARRATKARTRRAAVPKWLFPAAVAVVAASCFGAAFFLPEIRASLSKADFTLPKAPTHEVRSSTSNFSVTDRPDFTCQVVSVNDGDTLRCADGTRIRLHAVAARESDGTCSPGHPCPTASAEAARDTLRRLAEGRKISCLQTGTSYDRKAAICWTPSGQEINCAMVRSGTTLLWEKFDREAGICRS